MIRSISLLAAALVAGTALAAVANPAALRIMKERHEGMEQIGRATKIANRTLQSGSPDLSQLKAAARTYVALSPKVVGWYPPGTGPEAGKTHARAEIWQRPDEFRQDAKAFELSSIAFQNAVQSGNIPRIRGAFANLGKTCQGCHESFRQKS